MKQYRHFSSPVAYHPGEMLKEKLEELGLTPVQFAEESSLSLETVLGLINKSQTVTSDLALSLEESTQIPAHLWLNIQKEYDTTVASQDQANAKRHPWAAAAL